MNTKQYPAAYWRAVALLAHPAWVSRKGVSQAATRLLASLRQGPATTVALSERTGYSERTVVITMQALKVLGQVDARGCRWVAR